MREPIFRYRKARERTGKMKTHQEKTGHVSHITTVINCLYFNMD